MNEVVKNEPKLIQREDILSFEQKMATLPNVKYGDMDECPLTHSFAEGVYVREIFIPKGMLIVGKIHKHSHPNFLLSGEVIVATEDGGLQHLKAPMNIISKAGTKRVVYAKEDTRWVTVHVTKETDLDKIEEYVIAETYEDLKPTLSHRVNKFIDKFKKGMVTIWHG